MNVKLLLTSLLVASTCHAVGASSNYDAIYTNDDGTISIVGPHFRDPSGSANLSISPESSAIGLCTLYGQGSPVMSSMTTHEAHQNTALVGGNTHFTNYDTGEAITDFACEAPASNRIFPASRNYTNIALNNDGSTTIIRPQFFFSGKTLSINSNSDLDGICKLFGLKSVVAGSAQSEAPHGQSVMIGNSVKFAGYSDGNAITSLICQ